MGNLFVWSTNAGSGVINCGLPRRPSRDHKLDDYGGPDARGSVSDQLDGDGDIAANGLGIRARLVRGVDNSLRDLAIQVRQADIEAPPQEVATVRGAKIDLRVDGRIGGQSDPHLAGHGSHRTFEAGRPAGGEQLLRIGAG